MLCAIHRFFVKIVREYALIDSYCMKKLMLVRGGSRSTWGHVESLRHRSTSSGVGVEVGTPFKSSGRRSLATAILL